MNDIMFAIAMFSARFFLSAYLKEPTVLELSPFIDTFGTAHIDYRVLPTHVEVRCFLTGEKTPVAVNTFDTPKNLKVRFK